MEKQKIDISVIFDEVEKLYKEQKGTEKKLKLANGMTLMRKLQEAVEEASFVYGGRDEVEKIQPRYEIKSSGALNKYIKALFEDADAFDETVVEAYENIKMSSNYKKLDFSFTIRHKDVTTLAKIVYDDMKSKAA